ncbi:PilZ domain-containing protein [Neobacillus sp. YX16]|uniref:flagellar brake protein n=1 Tax=Neobacillus sp. YX16 TaxID=3047874 RepID=UPI0024C2B0AC|nr:PilZ domain-containing protein [Neobacillus sp. YX16]WHZ05405.1 PilZ domain-containing protein [Neobacillus sp. YX16]
MYPKVNQNIVLDIKGKDKNFKTIVAEISDKEILIGFPMDLNILGLLPRGTVIYITYSVGDDLYKFLSTIIGKRNENMPLFRLVKPKEKDIKKIQRRNNFRVKANLPMVLKDSEVTTVDISAGGIQISCKENYEIVYGEVVSGTLHIPGELEDVNFQGIVKRISRNANDERKNVAIAFTNLNQGNQEKITRYCFDKQRQMRLKSK